jgi:exodeoxyribonuclease VII small subunit
MAKKPAAVAAHDAETTFEAAMERLGEIVDRIEGEPLELDESLALFEEGVALLRRAGSTLDGAEDRVRQLVADGDAFRLETFPEEL